MFTCYVIDIDDCTVNDGIPSSELAVFAYESLQYPNVGEILANIAWHDNKTAPYHFKVVQIFRFPDPGNKSIHLWCQGVDAKALYHKLSK